MAAWKNRPLNAIALLLLLLAEPSGAEPPFSCPSLHNPEKQKIAAMTQGKGGWFFRRPDLRMDFSLLPETEVQLHRLSAVFRRQEATFVMVAIPPRGIAASFALDTSQPMQSLYNPSLATTNYAAMLARLEEVGIAVADAYPNARNAPDFFFKRDHHWKPEGAKLTAQAVVQRLASLPDYKIGTTRYSTTEEKQEALHDTAMLEELNRLCDTTLPPEEFPTYRTAREHPASEDALFRDAAPIVLLGSSFSDNARFNFDGFLSEFTGHDVANFSVSGGQLFTALASYAALPEGERLRPSIVLWEVAGHYDLNDGLAEYRQIIPALSGECSTEEALVERTVTLGKKPLTIAVPEAQNIHGQRFFLFLDHPQKAPGRLTITFDHQDGDGEIISIDHTQHPSQGRRYFLELNEELATPLVKITLSEMDAVGGRATLRLCRYKEEI